MGMATTRSVYVDGAYVTSYVFDPYPCSQCGKVEVRGQWWHLQGYYGHTGYYCPKCYDAIDRSPPAGSAVPAPYRCGLCGQHITDGKPCGCGARR